MDVRQSLIPTVLDESARGDRAYDIFSLLLRERIVFLGQEVDDHIANLIIAQILHLEAQDPDKEIQLYINSPGGVAYAGMAIYDVMQHVRPPVSTICVGMGMSAAAMILCAGCAGQAARAAELEDHDPPGLGRHPRRAERHGDPAARGACDDEADGADHRLPLREPLEQVERDLDRDYFMTAQEALDYGLIDEVLAPRRGVSAELLELADQAAAAATEPSLVRDRLEHVEA